MGIETSVTALNALYQMETFFTSKIRVPGAGCACGSTVGSTVGSGCGTWVAMLCSGFSITCP
jgi:hypothetical protein